jgi:hypothetical protein
MVGLTSTTVKRHLPSNQDRAHLDDSEAVVFDLNDLGPASWLQIREGRIQDLLVGRKCRQPLHMRSKLQFVLGHDLEQQRVAADAA